MTSVSKKWLQDYVNTKYASVPQQVKVSSKHKSKLSIECDEAWSFVNHQGNKQWIWLALDKKTREIVGCYIGELRGGLEVLEFSPINLSAMCCLLYRLLGGSSASYSKETT